MPKMKKPAKPSETDRKYKASPDLEPLMVPIEDLKPDPGNVRTHPERSIQAIYDSLARFGYQKPVVADTKNIVIAGNGTVEAARRLGWTHVPVSRTELTGKDRAAFAIADNRTAEFAEWDLEKLAAQVESLGEGVVIGFDPEEVAKIIKSVAPVEAPPEFPSVGEDIATEYRCPKCEYEWSGKPR